MDEKESSRGARRTHKSLSLTSGEGYSSLSENGVLSIRKPVEILSETASVDDPIEGGLIEGLVEKNVWNEEK